MTKRTINTVEEANAAIDHAISTLERARPKPGVRFHPYAGIGKNLGGVIGQVQAVRNYYSMVAMTPKSPRPLTPLDLIFRAAKTKTGPEQ